VRNRIINKLDLYLLCWRSFCLQAVWNFERMQDLGFLYILAPVLDKLYPEKEKRIQSYRRHLEFFNSHPYFANVLVGIVARLEEEMAKGGEVKPEEISAVKMSMGGAFGGIGDSLFWGAWRPFTALVACVLVVVFLGKWEGAWVAPVIFLFLYNFLHFHTRIKGVMEGYEKKTKVVRLLKKMYYLRTIWSSHVVGLALVLLAVLVVLFRDWEAIERLYFLAFFLSIVLLNRWRISAARLLYLLIGISCVGGYIF
jgi:fructoselysine and glucoselysine-specific PTS system IID component